jgi:hypothetical protein
LAGFSFRLEYKRYFFNAKSLSDAGVFNFSPRSTDLPGYLSLRIEIPWLALSAAPSRKLAKAWPVSSNPTGFVGDPPIYLHQPFPSLHGTLPNTDPSSANYQSSLLTTARDANRPGYVQNWNFTIQYLLPKQTVLEVAYVGNKGTRLWGQYAFSELDWPALQTALDECAVGDQCPQPRRRQPARRPVADGWRVGHGVTSPHDHMSEIDLKARPKLSPNYNSLQVTAAKHLTTGLGFLAAYTFSNAIGYVDGNGPGAYYSPAPQDYYNRRLERSVTTFNYPQDFKLTWVYDTPVGKGRHFDLGRVNYIVGGWRLAVIHNYRSGDPIALFQAGLNIPNGFASGIEPDSLIGVPETLGGAPTKVDVLYGTPYLNPATFSPPPVTPNGVPLRVGTAPRVLPNVRGPHHMDETFRMSKKFPLYKQKENTFFRLGITMTNPFNRAGRYIADPGVGDFGQVFANGGGRTVQLDARIEF